MWKILANLQKKLIWSIPSLMILGLIFGYFVDVSFLKALIIPLTFLMVYPMMVTLNIKELFAKGNTKLQVTTQAINFIVIPLLGLGVGKLFFPDNPLVAVGLLLISLLPTSGMTIAWTGFVKGNVHAAIHMTVVGLIAGSLLTPVYLKLFMGTVIEINIWTVFMQIGFIVFLPLVAGYITQILIIKKVGNESFNKKYKPKFPLLSTLGVLGIVFVSMALKAEAIIADPLSLLYFLVPIILIYAVNFFFSTFVAKKLFQAKDGVALVFGTAMRNLSIALAIALSVFGEEGSDIALIIAIAYIVQVQAATWYVKFAGKIFKIPAEEVEKA